PPGVIPGPSIPVNRDERGIRTPQGGVQRTRRVPRGAPGPTSSQHAKGPLHVRSDLQPESRLLTPAEVAALFRVDPKTVTRWAQQGKIRSIRTLGGHRRYSETEVQAFLDRPQSMPMPRPSQD